MEQGAVTTQNSSASRALDREGSRKTFVDLVARDANPPLLVWIQGVLVWCGALTSSSQFVLLDDCTGVCGVRLDGARLRELVHELRVGDYVMVVGTLEPTVSDHARGERLLLSARTVRDLSSSMGAQNSWIYEVIAAATTREQSHSGSLK